MKLCFSFLLFGLLPSAALAQALDGSGLAPAQKICPVTDYGAVADDGAGDTKAIQAAIDACKGTGGTVVLPAGQFDVGGIRFGSDMGFHFSPGSILKFIPDMELYEEVAPYEEDGETANSFYTALYAPRVRNLVISGQGVIDGNGPEFWDDNFYELGIGRPTLPRPQPAMELADCENVHVSGITFTNMPAYALRFNRCDGVSAVDVKVINDIRSPNTDGIQIRDTSNAYITRALIRTGDDGIVIKSELRLVENLIVTDSIVESDDGALKFGTASAKGVVNATFDNIILRNSRFGISLFQIDGGVFRNNRFTNFIIETGGRRERQYPIYVDIDRRNDRREYGHIENVVFDGITIRSNSSSLIAGNPAAPIRGLVFTNVNIQTTRKLADFSQSQKPKGNAHIVRDEDSIDYSQEEAMLVFAHIDVGRISGITIDEADPDRNPVGVRAIQTRNVLIRDVFQVGSEAQTVLAE